jgi:hypothetical protein
MTDEELIEQLREVTSGKLFFTNTPNHLRLTAADRIEVLVKKNNNLIELAMDEHKRAETTEYRLTKQIKALERELEAIYEGVGVCNATVSTVPCR